MTLNKITNLRNNIFKYEFCGDVKFMNNIITFIFYLYDYPDTLTYEMNNYVYVNEFSYDNTITLTCISCNNALLEKELRNKIFHEFFIVFKYLKQKEYKGR